MSVVPVAAVLSTGPAIVAIVAFAICAVLAVWLIPRRQRAGWQRAGIRGEALGELENSARSTLVQLLGGVAIVLTFVATWLQIADTRRTTDRTLKLTADQQELERFTRAVEQLDSPRPEVRVGGIYGLQQAARVPHRRKAVAQIMLTHLRSNHPLDKGDKRLRKLDARNAFFEGFRRRTGQPGPRPTQCFVADAAPWPDTQAALSVLLSLPRAVRSNMDLHGVDLIGVQIPHADFTGAILRDASLAGAQLEGARFDNARLFHTDMRQTCLRRATFKRTTFNFADTTGADFAGADLATANLVEGGITGAFTDRCTRLPERPVPSRCAKPGGP